MKDALQSVMDFCDETASTKAQISFKGTITMVPKKTKKTPHMFHKAIKAMDDMTADIFEIQKQVVQIASDVQEISQYLVHREMYTPDLFEVTAPVKRNRRTTHNNIHVVEFLGLPKKKSMRSLVPKSCYKNNAAGPQVACKSLHGQVRDTIRKIRVIHNLSLTDLGHLLGVSAGCVSHWETQRHLPNQARWDTLQSLATGRPIVVS